MKPPSTLLLLAAIAVVVGYCLTKAQTIDAAWFHGVAAWQKLARPYPDFGTGADLYGALLPQKWLGTRALGFLVGMLAALFLAGSVGAWRLPALFACEGAAMELIDAAWLAIGRGQGWSTAATGPAIVHSLLWAPLLLAAARVLWAQRVPAMAPAPVAARIPEWPIVTFLDRYFIWLCGLVVVAYACMKLLFAYWWWFDSIGFWMAAFRPFPDWGTGAQLFGAILPARMIGTRNLAYGVFMLFALWYGFRRGDLRLVGILILQGAVIEFFDGTWLAYGKYNAAWVGRNTDFYLNGGFAWMPDLLLVGTYLVTRPRRLASLPATH